MKIEEGVQEMVALFDFYTVHCNIEALDTLMSVYPTT
jgi:hypothetical protein